MAKKKTEENVIEEVIQEESPSKANIQVMEALGLRLKNKFMFWKKLRIAIEQEWIENLRQHKGIYDPEILSKLDKNSSKAYPKITRAKDNLVLSKLHEMLFPGTDRNWSVEPTPVPKVSKEIVMQLSMALVKQDPQTGTPILPTKDEIKRAIHDYSKMACEDMQQEMDDQFVEMKYNVKVGKQVLRSGIILGTGIAKGVLVEKTNKREWEVKKNNIVAKDTSIDSPFFQFVPVWNWYPDMTVTEQEDMEGCFERHIYTKHQVRRLMHLAGFNADTIKEYLKDHPAGDYIPEPWEQDVRGLSQESASGSSTSRTESGDYIDMGAGASSMDYGSKYEVLEYWGYVDGHDLAACAAIIDESEMEDEMSSNIWLLGGLPIKAIKNPMPGRKDPYKLFYYEKDETSIFGEGLPRVIRHSQLATAASTRMMLNNAAICLTGDTVVYRNQSSAVEGLRPSEITLKELWDTKHKHNSGLRRTKIRSVDEQTGEIFYNRIQDIHDNGIAPIFELKTVNGYAIKATGNHKFLSDTGEWQELDKFDIGDMIAVNGSVLPLPALCIDCGQPKKTNIGLRCRSCASKIENSSWNNKQADEAFNNNNKANAQTARQRWACQKNKKDICEKCGIRKETGTRLNIHHIDRSPYNNVETNLLTLCDPCHRYVHKRFDNIGNAYKHRYIDYDEIVNIEYMGEEQVFDLQMEGPNHNFIANGVVAHNCAGPQFEINWDLVDTDSLDIEKIHPMKLWIRRGMGIESQYPAVRVYQIDSHIPEYISIINQFQQFGDIESTLPTWMISEPMRSGNETAGAVSMKMGTINISLRDIVRNFDDFTENVVEALYFWNMEFNPKEEIKGDYKVKAKGSTSLIMKEVRINALNMFATTMLPEDWAYIPRRQFLEERVKANDLDITIRTEEEAQAYIQSMVDQRAKELGYKDAEAEISKKQAMALKMATQSKKTTVESGEMMKGEKPHAE